MKLWLTVILLCAGSAAFGDDLEMARRIHKGAVGIDSHIDTAQWVIYQDADLSKRNSVYHVDFPRLREGGMLAPYFALYVPTYYPGSEPVRRILQLRDAMQRMLDANPDQIELAYNASDVLRIQRAGRIAALLTIESGHAISDDLGVLRMFYRLGIRSMTLCHFRNNNWADSSTDKPQHDGLTEFGKEVVREMNRLGMIVDISHVSDKTFYDTLAVTTKPVVASHSSCRALSDFPRNMTDDMVRVSDARMSGTSYGACVLHVAPESFVGGPLAFVRDGDMIELDVDARNLELKVSDAELAIRRAAWTQPKIAYERGYGALFAQRVTQANEGCDFDFLHAGAAIPDPKIH